MKTETYIKIDNALEFIQTVIVMVVIPAVLAFPLLALFALYLIESH